MSIHPVGPGETLTGIARKYNTTVNKLAQDNGIANPDKIQVGQKLNVSGSASAARPGTDSPQNYTVRAGDTLSGIAQKFGTTTGALAKANNISNPNLIRVGQKLTIPGASASRPPSPPPSQSYTVRSGDTLSGIAQRFGTTTNALAKANNISNPNLIRVGQKLTIPGGTKPGSQDGFDPPATGGKPSTGPVTGPGNGAGTAGGVTVAQLRKVMPNLSQAKAEQYLPHLNRAMAEAKINTPKRQAAFLAQLAHESGEFRYMEEIASGAAYEGRKDLGNTQPGDGVRFKGRGPIQLTGRSNYRAAGKALGIDLENNPKRAADPDVGFRTAAWFWNSRNLNTYADAGNFREVTRRINGGYNGLASREAYYQRALNVLS
ncbi:LysM peptidoglycan-binding domain-containing protein [Stigmatella aurantiaca]|uniref:Glycoside hydrolase, family 19 n=1 Tax=Stigmatella aurantiaca (strain DW4/3-1) TaxID=378806 RepID=Q08VR7_STIAD|nr:LysM peptidoglycan-binding domain-containing protein [Stigmatella aurantiaca]ADO74485.1 Glycoside hydrolase, family 19 [Stigmatella aurantiaca DW4/3-1]EAU64584.1 glycoside hydrolase, family 19 [Stigmatella aurantiaca DW4/3-1]